MKKHKEREITKIVCFSVFNGSYVLEHLHNEDSYLLKLCRDPNILEQVVDAMHPDIILIDCSGNPSCASETEMVIELEDIVISENEAFSENDRCENTGRENDVAANPVNDVFASSNTPASISYLPDCIPIWHIATKAQIIFIFDSDPGMAVKCQCLENRCDVMVAPFPFEELKFRIKLHSNQKELNQQVLRQKETLNRAVAHIDNLKQMCLNTKQAWLRENELLHHSLKQINMMTDDRDILKKELRTSRIKLSDNIKGISSFLSGMVESRNEHQKGHSKRVAEISAFVADKIGIDPKSVKVLRNAAMLHEVGMLLIPSSILNKNPSQWSDYEKSMMLHHPSNGAAYLEKCPGFEKAAGVIRHLHENSDGTGSPEGLKKRYIPLLSRVLAGADVLDQIWIDNPYASVDRMLELLEEYAGSRLDPSLVNFLEKYLVTSLNYQVKPQIVLNDNENMDNNNGNGHNNNNSNVRLKEIAVYQLKPGMVIGTGLFTKTGTKLFSPGTTITEDSIRMLSKYSKEYPVDETVFIKVE